MRFRFGDCVLDSETHELLREGRGVRVSPKAFQLLSVLIEKRPKALSKDELHAVLWPKTFVADTTLTGLVKEIRAVIGDDARTPRFIRTISAFGYAFSGEGQEVRRSAPTGFSCRVIGPESQVGLVEGENVLGRGPDSVLWMDDDTVSRRHARIRVEKDSAVLEDLDSRNGTFRWRSADRRSVRPSRRGQDPAGKLRAAVSRVRKPVVHAQRELRAKARMSEPESGQSVTLQPGSRLGPYEILSLLGAGGMGEVYRARDTRLGRDVALKILAGPAGEDSGRFRRFQTEAKAAAGLSHPNIVAVHDIGQEAGTPYIVSELVLGGTLTALLERGPLPVKKLLDLAIPMAEALAAAHANGVVHRDLKPDNILLALDGTPKIADFGLAKYFQPTPSEGSLGTTLPDDRTREGTIVGTVGYMSPEQARGAAVDYRSDQFSFGSVLYEMATGRRAFQKKTVVDTLAAILNEEPERIEEINPKMPAPLSWIVERCLAKEPARRYASTEDLARDLESVRDRLSRVSGALAAAAPPQPRRALWFGLATASLVAASLFAGKVLWRQPPASPPSFHQLTFRRGTLDRARFASDGHTVAYGARWEGAQDWTVFTQRLDAPGAQPQAVLKADLLAVSGGEMAVLLPSGSLARVPLTGGTPREIAKDVADADWRGGEDFAIVREVGDRQRLEWPLGHVLHESASHAEISYPRISPGGDRIAFLESRQESLGASVVVADRDGRSRVLSKDWLEPDGLAWSPDGREIWFSGARERLAPYLQAVGLDGRERVIAQVPGSLRVHDALPDGRVLLAHETYRFEAWGQLAGDEKPRDLTWSQDTQAAALSDDGRTFVFLHTGEFGGGSIATYLRRVGDPAPVRLGEGFATDLSRDGAWVVSVPVIGSAVLLLPTGPGTAQRIRLETLAEVWGAWFTPDGRHLLITGREKGRAYRLFVYDLPGGPLKPITPEGVGPRVGPVTPDGRWVAAHPPGAGPRPLVLYPLEGGEPRPIPGLRPGEDRTALSPDGRFLFVREFRESAPSTEITGVRLDTQTGARRPWMQFELPDAAGVGETVLVMTPDGRHWAVSYRRQLSDLYLVEGLK